MSMGMSMRMEQRAMPACELRLGLRQLLSLQLQLRCDDHIPFPIRGFEGMCAADALLVERNSRGVLVGGLSETVLSKQRTKGQLEKHKYVDALVIDTNFYVNERFEGGIDWWLPYSGMVDVQTDISSGHKELQWWQNGHGVLLQYGITMNLPEPPGLYIMSRDSVVSMREEETLVMAEGMEYDEDVLNAFRNRFYNRVKTRVPSFIAERFSGKILADPYITHPGTDLAVFGYGVEDLVGIRSGKTQGT